MNKKGRLENSLRNSVSGLITQGCNALMGLVTRTFFIRCLSAEYLGVNGLFSNILMVLSLADMGIGSAIVYSLYKPIANNDERKIAQLLNLYKTAYRRIGAVIALLGVSIIPFLGYITKNQTDIDHLTLIYLLFLSNTVLSYFFSYKRSILSADQMERVISRFTLAYQIIRNVLQIISLEIFKNYIVYLCIQITCLFLENLSISLYVDRKYSFLKVYHKEKLDKEDQRTIFDNIKALFIYKIGSTALDGTDNIIISRFDGVISVGLLSNYSLITGALQAFIFKVSHALTGSIGNFIAKEDDSRRETILDNVTFLHFILYGLFFVCCWGSLNPFILVWAGENYLLSGKAVFVYCLNIYIYGMMNSVWLFRSTMGLFVYGRWRPLVSAVINIVVSIFLGKRIGLLGVLLGTTITRTVTNVWYDPYIVYKHGLKKNPLKYYLMWLKYLAVILLDAAAVYSIEKMLQLQGILAIIVYAVIGIIVFSVSVFVFFGRSSSFAYFKGLCRKLYNRLR